MGCIRNRKLIIGKLIKLYSIEPHIEGVLNIRLERGWFNGRVFQVFAFCNSFLRIVISQIPARQSVTDRME